MGGKGGSGDTGVYNQYQPTTSAQGSGGVIYADGSRTPPVQQQVITPQGAEVKPNTNTVQTVDRQPPPAQQPLAIPQGFGIYPGPGAGADVSSSLGDALVTGLGRQNAGAAANPSIYTGQV